MQKPQKNIIIHGFGQPRLRPALYEILRSKIIAHAEVITLKHSFDPSDISADLRVYDHREAAYCDYPIPPHEQKALSGSLVFAMRSCEAVALKMQEREEKWKGKLDYNTRKRIYLRHLRYWNHIILTKSIEHYISINIPHSIYDYIILKLCQHYGIPTTLTNQNLPDFMQVLSSDDGIASFASKLTREVPSIEELPVRVRAVIYKQTGQGQKMPAYSGKAGIAAGREENQATLRGSTFSRVKRHLRSGNLRPLFLHTTGKIASKWRDWRLRVRYNKHAGPVDLNVPFIYMALHYQPEMSTCPLGGPFVDQDLAVSIVAEAARAMGMPVYVKEHFAQKSFGRRATLYDDLAEDPGVQIVSMDTPSRVLIQNATCVATITGTTAWEALFENTPAIVFGSCFHEEAPGLRKVDSSEEVAAFLSEIRDGGVEIPIERLAAYLLAYHESTIEGNVASGYEIESRLGPDTASNLASAVLKRLDAN